MELEEVIADTIDEENGKSKEEGKLLEKQDEIVVKPENNQPEEIGEDVIMPSWKNPITTKKIQTSQKPKSKSMSYSTKSSSSGTNPPPVDKSCWGKFKVMFLKWSGFESRDYYGRIKRMIILAYHIMSVVVDLALVIYRMARGKDQTGVYFWADASFYSNMVVMTVFFIDTLIILVFKHKNVEAVVTFISLLFGYTGICVGHYQSVMGIFDPILSFAGVPLFISLYTFRKIWLKIFWISFFIVIVLVALVFNLIFGQMYITFFKNSQIGLGDIFLSYLVIFTPYIYAIISFFIQVNPEIAKRKKEIKKIEPIKADLDLIIAEQEHLKNREVPHFKVESGLLEVNFEELEIIKKIGEGGSGNPVFEIKWRDENYAYKLFKLQKFDENQFREFEQESKLLASLHHPNVLNFYGVTIDEKRVGILLELCRNGDLTHYFNKHKGKIPTKEKIRMLFQISKGCEYLHSKNIIHRDLKCDNVLLNHELKCKIMDFGISKVTDSMNAHNTKRVGTSIFMAPEVVTSRKYNDKIDVYSFAIISWILMNENFNPFEREGSTYGLELKISQQNLRPRVKKEEDLKSELEKKMQDMIVKCWDKDSSIRYTFTEIRTMLSEMYHGFDDFYKENENMDNSSLNAQVVSSDTEIKVLVKPDEKLEKIHSVEKKKDKEMEMEMKKRLHQKDEKISELEKIIEELKKNIEASNLKVLQEKNTDLKENEIESKIVDLDKKIVESKEKENHKPNQKNV